MAHSIVFACHVAQTTMMHLSIQCYEVQLSNFCSVPQSKDDIAREVGVMERINHDIIKLVIVGWLGRNKCPHNQSPNSCPLDLLVTCCQLAQKEGRMEITLL